MRKASRTLSLPKGSLRNGHRVRANAIPLLRGRAERVRPLRSGSQPALAGQLLVFETVFALLYGFLHEGRWPRPLESVAIVLMLAGVLWSARRHRRPVNPA